MAIPTQFSVTRVACRPIANPLSPQDLPSSLDAESVSIVSDASILPPLAGGDINAPSDITPEDIAIIDSPDTLSSESAAGIDAPATTTAKPKEDIDAPSTASAESVPDIDAPDEATAKAVASISSPSEATPEDASDIDAPTATTAKAKASIDAPSEATAESAGSIDAPSDLTPKSVQVIEPPDFTVVDRIQWDFVGSLLDWTANNATLTAGASSFTAEMTGADFQLLKGGLTGGRRSQYLLWVQIRCTTATVSGNFTAFTKNSAHGFTTEYSTSVPVEYEQGVYQNVYINLGNIYEYSEDGLTELRLDPFEGSLETFEIERIWFGRYETDVVPRDEKAIGAPAAATSESAAATVTPSVASAEAVVSPSAPSALTPVAGTLTEPPFPRNHPRILYENQLQQYSAVTVSIGTNGGHSVIPNTYQRWSFDSDGSEAILFEMPSIFTADTFCIGAHNIGGATVTLLLDADTDPPGLVTIDSVVAEEGKAIMFHFDTEYDYGRMQLNIQGVTGERYIGYISAGIALQMQRPLFNGHVPITDGDVTNYYHNQTESGNIIGQAIRSQGYKTSYTFNNIDDAWYREYFAPFKQAVKLQPFFIAWNLLKYPNDVGFGRIAQDISAPMQNGTVTMRGALSFDVLGY